jgi:hypothetical protein
VNKNPLIASHRGCPGQKLSFAARLQSHPFGLGPESQLSAKAKAKKGTALLLRSVVEAIGRLKSQGWGWW